MTKTELRLQEEREFAKLNDDFKTHGVQPGATFPPKNLFGRIGDWTPSLKLAPAKHDDLVQYRKVQLDVWLVSVCNMYNLGDLPHSLARSVYEFLTLSDRPPCDLENIGAAAAGVGGGEAFRLNNPLSFTLGSSIRQVRWPWRLALRNLRNAFAIS